MPFARPCSQNRLRKKRAAPYASKIFHPRRAPNSEIIGSSVCDSAGPRPNVRPSLVKRQSSDKMLWPQDVNRPRTSLLGRDSRYALKRFGMDEQKILFKLREICLALPGASETVTFGHPTFQAGKMKTFAVLE